MDRPPASAGIVKSDRVDDGELRELRPCRLRRSSAPGPRDVAQAPQEAGDRLRIQRPIVYGSDLCHLVNISGLEEVKGLSVGWVPEERTQTTLRRIDIWWPDESDRDEQYKGETLMDRAEWDDVVAERHTERSRAWLHQIFPKAVVSGSMRMEEDLGA